MRNECNNFVLHNVDVTTADKILKNLDVAKARIDQIFTKFLNDSDAAIAIHPANMSLKLNTFPWKCKIHNHRAIFENLNCYTFINLALGQIIPQVLACLA